MRLTKIPLRDPELFLLLMAPLFSGLILGPWCIGVCKTSTGRKRVFKRAKFVHNFYGFVWQRVFRGLSSLPKYTDRQIKQALVALCMYSPAGVRNVLVADMGLPLSQEVMDQATDYLDEHGGVAEQLPTSVRNPESAELAFQSAFASPFVSSPRGAPTGSDYSESSRKSAMNIVYERNPRLHPDYVDTRAKLAQEQLVPQPPAEEPENISS